MTRQLKGLTWTLAIAVSTALLMVGCERGDKAESGDSAEAAAVQATDDVQTPDESANSAGSDVEQEPAVPESKAAEAASEVEKAAASDVKENEASKAKVIAYYFHRTLRCPTCLSIEKQAREAIETGYSDELESGNLEWRAVNIEEEGNEHFESDFELSGSSLVIVQMKGEETVAWKNLAQVWELVEKPVGFQEYVWTELMEYFPG